MWVHVHECMCLCVCVYRPTHLDMHTWKSELAMTVFPLSTLFIKTGPESSSKLSLGLHHWTQTHIQDVTIVFLCSHGTLPIVHRVSLQHPCKHGRCSMSLCITACFVSQRAWVDQQDDSLHGLLHDFLHGPFHGKKHVWYVLASETICPAASIPVSHFFLINNDKTLLAV